MWITFGIIAITFCSLLFLLVLSVKRDEKNKNSVYKAIHERFSQKGDREIVSLYLQSHGMQIESTLLEETEFILKNIANVYYKKDVRCLIKMATNYECVSRYTKSVLKAN
jgi:hypothetical protein